MPLSLIVRQCVICGADISRRHPRAMVCSDPCAAEREHRRYEDDRERITARQRDYNRRKAADVREARLRRFSEA
jgi:hypothetical protein